MGYWGGGRKQGEKIRCKKNSFCVTVRQKNLVIVQVDEMHRWDVKNSAKRPIQQPHSVKTLSDLPGR